VLTLDGDKRPKDDQTRRRSTKAGQRGIRKPDYFAGGAGLVSTAPDYLRFAEMLRRRGEYEGTRVLGTRTVDYMTKNHLPGNGYRVSFGASLAIDAPERGQGYGLGVGVTIDSVAQKVLDGTGSYGWSGLANTHFWVDPTEELTVVFLTQLLPAGVQPMVPQLKQLVYQAIVD
jgi:CubicO group peptidase (beta-lactamase class C family)